jgi:hypothetical protein
MDFLIVLAVVLVVALLVTAPLRRRGEPEEDVTRGGAELADLEAAKEAKYREIRDAELDYRTGKLSEQDHRALDDGLRAEAVELLRRLDRLRERQGEREAGQAGERDAERAGGRDAGQAGEREDGQAGERDAGRAGERQPELR